MLPFFSKRKQAQTVRGSEPIARGEQKGLTTLSGWNMLLLVPYKPTLNQIFKNICKTGLKTEIK